MPSRDAMNAIRYRRFRVGRRASGTYVARAIVLSGQQKRAVSARGATPREAIDALYEIAAVKFAAGVDVPGPLPY